MNNFHKKIILIERKSFFSGKEIYKTKKNITIETPKTPKSLKNIRTARRRLQ